MGGMDQRRFVRMVRRLSEEAGYRGLLYLCRDHGGPWQRNVELNEKYPVEQAMEIARRSFRADIEAGFNYLHVDPTKCPFPYAQEDLARWTVELIEHCESTRQALGRGPIDYEVGTEDIQGGLTTSETFGAFLQRVTTQLQEKGLPIPACIVGQTGTLLREDRNVGRFDRNTAEELARVAARYGIGLKEHNGDYLSAASCRIHPDIGVSAVNVAPEFGLVETDACLALADLEMKLVREGWLAEANCSGFRRLLLEKSLAEAPWQKWLTEDTRRISPDVIASDSGLRLLIARVCGHYVYNGPDVRAARQTLFENVDRFALVEDAASFVKGRVRRCIEFYIHHFRLEGVEEIAAADRNA